MADGGKADTREGVQDVHLIVLIHGLWGSSANLRHLCRTIIHAHPGAYLAPPSPASSRIVTTREAERIKKGEEKRRRALERGKPPPKDPHAWEQALLQPTATLPQDTTQLVLLNIRTNEDRTYDGMDWGAERARLEIDAEVTRLRNQTTSSGRRCHVAKVSIIGYSLGGLIGRYLVGLLYSRHFFTLVPDEHIPADIVDAETRARLKKPPQPVQFVTVATPHLGMLPPSSSFRRFAAFIGARSLSRTGEQLFLRDSGWEAIDADAEEGHTTRRGLIEAMSRPESLFIAALNRFEKVVIYANAVNDPTVPFRTGAIYPHDPFLVPNLRVETDPDYPGMLKSFAFPSEPLPPTSLVHKLKHFEVPFFLNPRRNPLPFPLNYLIIPLFPLAFPVFVVLVLTRFRAETGESKERIRELRRLWREERALELQNGGAAGQGKGGSEAQDGRAAAAQVDASLRRPSQLEEAGRRMSGAPGEMGSDEATSGTATPKVAPAPQANGTVQAGQPTRNKRWFSLPRRRTEASTEVDRQRQQQRRADELEEHLGEQSRIRLLIKRVEGSAVDAAEMGDGTLRANRRGAGDDHDDDEAGRRESEAEASLVKGEPRSTPSKRPPEPHNQPIVPIPPEHVRRGPPQPTLFPVQSQMIAHLDVGLGGGGGGSSTTTTKLERRLAYFPKVINAHPIIIVRMPGTELCKMGEGVVRHLVDSLLV